MIWILTAGFGDGHNTAARSVSEALTRLRPEEKVEVTDLISDVMPCLSKVLKAAYQAAIIYWPAAWRLTYQIIGSSRMTRQGASWQLPLLRAMEHKFDQERPRLIVSTYPVYSGLLAALRVRRDVPPIVTVITDSVSVHPIWVAHPSDRFCVADDETQKVIETLGVPRERIRVTGFPVSLAFVEDLSSPARQPVQRILYLPSTPGRHVAATLEALRPLLLSGVKLTMPVGKHGSRLYQILRFFTDTMPAECVEIIGWTKRIPELLRTHDVVICKAGGAILHEVLAARVPAVIDYVVPGQEEGNAEMLTSRGCGIRTHSPTETASAVASILAHDGAAGRRMRAAMMPISVPDAAMKTAQAALKLVKLHESS
ncbi:MAG: MGDG synthase family glycosyltransferase [Prosthecobacter sp.]